MSVSVAAGSVSVPEAIELALSVVVPDEDPASRRSLLLNVCGADQVWARLSSATVPVFAGSVAVPEAVPLALSVVVPDVAPPSRRSPDAIVTLVPLLVTPVMPPNTPDELYCSCVFDPPGVPLPPEQADHPGTPDEVSLRQLVPELLPAKFTQCVPFQ